MHANIGLIDVVHHTAPDNPAKMCLEVKDAPIAAAVRPAQEGRVGLQIRGRETPQRRNGPTWWQQPHPFLETDALFPTEARVAWAGRDKIVYDRGGA